MQLYCESFTTKAYFELIANRTSWIKNDHHCIVLGSALAGCSVIESVIIHSMHNFHQSTSVHILLLRGIRYAHSTCPSRSIHTHEYNHSHPISIVLSNLSKFSPFDSFTSVFSSTDSSSPLHLSPHHLSVWSDSQLLALFIRLLMPCASLSLFRNYFRISSDYN